MSDNGTALKTMLLGLGSETYVFEVADWCTTVAQENSPVIIRADDDADASSKMAYLRNVEDWGRISQASADSAWPDHKTVAAWNITHPVHGNYQARLARE